MRERVQETGRIGGWAWASAYVAWPTGQQRCGPAVVLWACGGRRPSASALLTGDETINGGGGVEPPLNPMMNAAAARPGQDSSSSSSRGPDTR